MTPPPSPPLQHPLAACGRRGPFGARPKGVPLGYARLRACRPRVPDGRTGRQRDKGGQIYENNNYYFEVSGLRLIKIIITALYSIVDKIVASLDVVLCDRQPANLNSTTI